MYHTDAHVCHRSKSCSACTVAAPLTNSNSSFEAYCDCCHYCCIHDTHVYTQNMPQSTGCVHLQAHSDSAANTVAVLEEELRHYSSLTAGTTISFIFNPTGVEAAAAAATAAAAAVAAAGGRKKPVLPGDKKKISNGKKAVGARREVKINVVQCLDAGGHPVESVCIQVSAAASQRALPSVSLLWRAVRAYSM
jgi:hypothetical protein